jgi:predicted nucleic acid-binding protein
VSKDCRVKIRPWGQACYPATSRIVPHLCVRHSAEKKNRIGEADSIRFIELLNQLPIIVEQESPERMTREIFALARTHNVSSYDASYLDLAMRKGLPIATLDKNLSDAARRSNVPLLPGV